MHRLREKVDSMGIMLHASHKFRVPGRWTSDQGEMQKRDTLIESLGIRLETVHVNYCRLKRELGDHISREKAGPRAIHTFI